MNDFYFPKGHLGVGSEIRWCGRWSGGKYCQLCGHHTEFKDWSQNWKWYYLLTWYGENHKAAWTLEQSHYQYYFMNWRGTFRRRYDVQKYNTTGLNKNDFKALLKKGCRLNCKCKCVKVAQRGHWYCPQCFETLEAMAQHKKFHIHDMMIVERKELKEEFLIARLSGII